MTISTFTDLKIETKRKEDKIEYVGLGREPIGLTINATSAFQALLSQSGNKTRMNVLKPCVA